MIGGQRQVMVSNAIEPCSLFRDGGRELRSFRFFLEQVGLEFLPAQQ
jgi:hypothetical protein